MTASILSSNYEIVIPEDVRQTLDLKPGQNLLVTTRDGHIELHPILSPDQLIGCLAGTSHIEFKREPDRILP